MKYLKIIILIVIALSLFSCRRKGSEIRIDPQNNSVFRISCEMKNYYHPFDSAPMYHAEYEWNGRYEEYYLKERAGTPREFEIKYTTILPTHPTVSMVNVVIGIREINGEYKGYYLMWKSWADNIPTELDITTNLTAGELEEYYPECYPKINKQIKVRNVIHKDYKKIVVDFSKTVLNLDFFNNLKFIE